MKMRMEQCPQCEGSGSVKCRHCDGEGMIETDRPAMPATWSWAGPWCVVLAILGGGLWTLNAAAAPAAKPAAGAPVAAHYTLVVELELLQDGTSRAVSSQVITGSAQLVELAKVWVAREAGAVAPAQSPAAKGSTAQDGKPSFAGQCTAIAQSSGKQCRKRAVSGSDKCELHQPTR